MIEPMRKLLAVREARLLALHADLARALADLASVDRELATLDGERQQIDEQHRMWEDQWQDWLRDDRILRHGQDYNMHHVALAAWAEDVAAQRSEVETRRAAAEAQVVGARQAMFKAQQRVDALKREHTTAVARARAQIAGIIESRALEDFVGYGAGRECT